MLGGHLLAGVAATADRVIAKGGGRVAAVRADRLGRLRAEPDSAGVELHPARRIEGAAQRRALWTDLRVRRHAPGSRARARALEVVVEERAALVLERLVHPGVVRAARVTEVPELERDRGALIRGAQQVVD